MGQHADCLERARAYLAEAGSGLQQALAEALLSGQPLSGQQATPLLSGQRPDGAWAAFWSGERGSVDATSYRITQALAAGLSPTQEPAIERGALWLRGQQRPDGLWQEDDALAEIAPPWARPGDVAAACYLTANAGWVLARCGMTPPAIRASDALADRLSADGSLPSFAHAQWLAAGLWLLLGRDELATRALAIMQAGAPGYSAGQLVWLLNCLLDSRLPDSHPLIAAASARLCAQQRPDGGWPSDDGPTFAPQVTLEAMRALSLLSDEC